MEITYGNREGQYFTEWRFDELRSLLEHVHVGPCPPTTEVLSIESAAIWYDAVEDYHRLKFTANGHIVEVRLYKVFSVYIDGKDVWSGCPRYEVWEFANSIRRHLGVVIPQS